MQILFARCLHPPLHPATLSLCGSIVLKKSSIHHQRLVTPPIAHRTIYPDEPDTFKRIHWADARFPAHPFIPVQPQFAEPIFHVLAFPNNRPPIVPSGHGYSLAPETTKSWTNLENDLRCIVSTMLRNLGLVFPLTTELPPNPSSHGYTRIHKSFSTASKCAMASRDGFLPLMGLSLYLISRARTLLRGGNES